MFAYGGNNPVLNLDVSGSRYIASTSVQSETAEERSTACQFQSQVALSKYNNQLLSPSKSLEEIALTEMRENGMTFYKGAPLTLAHNGSSAFTFGYIFMGAGGDENLLKHEYGHIVQSRELGVWGYTIFIVAPSLIGFGVDSIGLMPNNTYYNLPWEYKADEYGGASHYYQAWAKPVSDAYWAYAKFMTMWLF